MPSVEMREVFLDACWKDFDLDPGRKVASFGVRCGLEANGKRGFPGSWKKFEERVLAWRGKE